MKRSEINTIVREAKAFFREHNFHLPPFAFWTPDDWAQHDDAVREIVETGLGWDIFDGGLDRFDEIGLVLFTLRNGRPENLAQGRGKVYAEKILIAQVNQVTPLHFHWKKTEDIINRGGGKLMLQLYNATDDEQLADTDVTVRVDGIPRTVPAGGNVELRPGQSITLEPYCYHKFWAAEEPVLIGEVSTVNDDQTDNRFFEPINRFAEIEEDEPAEVVLVNEYDKYVRF